MPGTLVITRPREDAEKLAASLKQKGLDCIIEPMLSIKILYDENKNLEALLENKPQAILATSKHAISAFALLNSLRSFPMITVGQATAVHARKLGFSNVAFANGNAVSIVSYIMGNLSPSNGNVLYIRGRDISTDIAAKLTDANFTVDSIVLYKAEKARKFSEQLCTAMKEKKVDSVAFYSQNTAKAYAKLCTQNDLAEAHRSITALCLSAAIADTAKNLLPWKNVVLFPPYLADAD